MFHLAISVCQGYDISEAAVLFRDWENFRCVYNYGLTRNVLKVINHHKQELAQQMQEEEGGSEGSAINWKHTFSARALQDLDENFTLKMCKETCDVDDFYRCNSSSRVLDRITLPVLLINAKDDPIVPEELHKYPKQLVGINKNALFVRPAYGGHLGFFEGGLVVPNRVTWLDRMLTEFIQVALKV